ncbi:TPA: restriction endonuclease subunit S [Escherichia fergusonii]|uniref:restriction endonuclease subunit S n=1 Tax=Escherichia fergusonii TaxID=564 RepID=UPI0015EEF701|nr:restriction endonuclease subunit S [Escherichia fergusonii]QMG48704.1 restriction endonuclease subunit S [Escherichia fergusonii]HAJ6532624.1 restriction endonuclease subunit S [Escherichia fergusonii]HAJ6562585.1 restriction endonuclease subunit S [Escherichia fergusonii]HAJ6572065.1 restriction endonuclease subunit S [Escherichia fergusonii]HCO8001496.1 restriction endonuclease subunit S [Escherichia fergusonii]
MSEMSYLEKLLDGVEVEWKTLGSIAELKRGTSITKKDVIDGTIPVVAGGRTPAYYHNTSNRDGQTIVIAGSGAYAGFVSWWEEPIFVSDAFTVKPHNILLPRYCYHFLMNMQQQLHEFKSGGGVPHVYPRDVSPILIPIPCPDNPEKSLAIQSEIVRILDKFTALTAELTAELNMRKKQYNYYRDQLLSFDESSVEWKTLLEACDYVDYRGKTPKKTQSGIFLVTAKNIRMGYIDYHASQEFISEEDYAIVMRRGLPKKGDVLITTEAPCGFVAQVNRENIALAQRVIKYRSKNTQLSNSFLKHYLLGSQFQDKLMQAATGSTVKGIKGSRLHQLKIPIPSKVEQDRIVAILDKFDTLTNSITEGLPREIELRQKQYEYYRDLLFSFPTPETVSN